MRVWREEIVIGQFEWRAYVVHARSGEAGYVRCWEDMVNFLETLDEKENTR